MISTVRVPLVHGAYLELEMDTSDPEEFLELVIDRLKDPADILRHLADQLRQVAANRFEQGGWPPWQPHAISTLYSRRFLNFTGGVLIGTGGMMNRWTNRTNPEHKEVINPEAWTVSIGTSNPIDKYHQEGTRPYIIRAKSGGALRFFGSNGRRVFARHVNHPGLVARPVTIKQAEASDMAAMIADHLLAEK